MNGDHGHSDPNPIARFNAAFGYHFAAHATYDSHTLTLMADLAKERSQTQLAADLRSLLETGGQPVAGKL